MVTVQAPAQPGDGVLTFSPPGTETAPHMAYAFSALETTLTVEEGGEYVGLFRLTGVVSAPTGWACRSFPNPEGITVTIRCEHAGSDGAIRVILSVEGSDSGRSAQFKFFNAVISPSVSGRFQFQFADDYGRLGTWTVVASSGSRS